MRRLFRANARRLIKNRLYWCFVFLMTLFCVYVCVMQYSYMKRTESVYELDNFLFGSFMLIGVGLAVVISLHIGTEYSDGTIRNKLVVGKRREDIYLSGVLVCSLGAVFASLFATIVTFIVGYPMFGGLEMGFSEFLLSMLNYCMAVVAYASIYHMLAKLIANKAHTATANLLLAFLLLFVAIYLYQRLSAPPEIIEGHIVVDGGEWTALTEPNPDYLSGMMRELYQFFYDFIPSGQAVQVANMQVLHPFRMLVYSLVMILLSNTAGIVFFCRKDIR